MRKTDRERRHIGTNDGIVPFWGFESWVEFVIFRNKLNVAFFLFFRRNEEGFTLAYSHRYNISFELLSSSVEGVGMENTNDMMVPGCPSTFLLGLIHNFYSYPITSVLVAIYFATTYSLLHTLHRTRDPIGNVPWWDFVVRKRKMMIDDDEDNRRQFKSIRHFHIPHSPPCR